jgi:hypothetical protein
MKSGRTVVADVVTIVRVGLVVGGNHKGLDKGAQLATLSLRARGDNGKEKKQHPNKRNQSVIMSKYLGQHSTSDSNNDRATNGRTRSNVLNGQLTTSTVGI